MLAAAGPVGDEAAVAHDRGVVGRRANRRLILVVDDRRLLHPLEEQHGRAIAADAGRFGLDDAERKRHGDHRIDDVAALLEREPAGLRRQRMTGDDDRALRGHDRLDERLLGDHRVDDVLELRVGLGLSGARLVLRRAAVATRRADAPVE